MDTYCAIVVTSLRKLVEASHVGRKGIDLVLSDPRRCVLTGER